MSRTQEIDAMLATYQESLALEQNNLAEVTRAYSRAPGDVELRRKVREKRNYIDEVTQEIADLTAARQVLIDQENSEEGLAAVEARKKALTVFIEHADTKFVEAGADVDRAFMQLMLALENLRLAREGIHEAWGKHFSKLDLDGDRAEEIGFLTRMNLGDSSPYLTAALGEILADLIGVSSLNMYGIATVNIMGYVPYDPVRKGFAENRMTMRGACAIAGIRAKNRAIEHEARYG